MLAFQPLILIKHPCHYLGICVDIRSRNVYFRAYEVVDFPYVSSAHSFKLALGKSLWLYHHSAFCPSKRQIHNSTFHCHQKGQSLDLLKVYFRMESNAALCWSSGVIELNPVAAEILYFSRVKLHRITKCKNSLSDRQNIHLCLLEVQDFCNFVYLVVAIDANIILFHDNAKLKKFIN